MTPLDPLAVALVCTVLGFLLKSVFDLARQKGRPALTGSESDYRRDVHAEIARLDEEIKRLRDRMHDVAETVAAQGATLEILRRGPDGDWGKRGDR